MIFTSIRAAPRNAVTVSGLQATGSLTVGTPTDETSAMKLSAVSRCVDVLSDSIGKLPIFVMDRKTRERVEHPILRALTVRPNEMQTPSDAKKMVEANRTCGGNGYLWIIRNPYTLAPEQLLPIPHQMVFPFLADGLVWFRVVHPMTGEQFLVDRADMIHLMAYSRNGWQGVSVLERAAEVVGAGRAAQQYNLAYYQNGGQPSGVLQTEADLSSKKVKIRKADGTEEEVGTKDLIRTEWEKIHSGPTNAQRIAILDYGLKYTPIAISNRDAQFVEQADISVQDIARFFGVPLYKLQSGKQSYDSNEQNAIEYVTGTLHPIVTRYEEELTWKLLTEAEIKNGLEIRINMMAELRGDFNTRANWYKTMRDVSVFSPNDIAALEDIPDVPGGNTRRESLNFVPLEDWPELSRRRNGGNE